MSTSVIIDFLHGRHLEISSTPTVKLYRLLPLCSRPKPTRSPPLAAAGYRAVTVDVRGYGRSSKPTATQAYRSRELVADHVAVVEALGEERAVIVGHDWGASGAACVGH